MAAFLNICALLHCGGHYNFVELMVRFRAVLLTLMLGDGCY